MSYSELVNHIEGQKRRMTKFDVVCWLIGYQGNVDAIDLDNIQRAYMDMIID